MPQYIINITKGSFDFIVSGDTPLLALNHLSKFLRDQRIMYKEQAIHSTYKKSNVERCSLAINSIRRYKRTYFKWDRKFPYIRIFEYPTSVPTKVSYFELGMDGPYITNILSELSLTS